ncbi:hypothetical protein LQZ24_04225 [Fructobacillus sp. M1-13]|uniref:Uncharacterized protein n=1 Tax=Fructobacillus papyriferae TaxID=2713171 RepID=A0ABS5QSV4_9LACO|nr:hypothetical protein [Fructobacillus papyriferae]MBS9335461.1 hypothetical protein [Fructobacillus papyriferae]MCD2159231.1 hypothetical protein [Fructobacillus papyriferae]
MKIERLKLIRRDYWVSLQAIEWEDERGFLAKEPEAPVLDYRVLCFSYDDYLVIDWGKAYPGPNPLNLTMRQMTNESIWNLEQTHGIIRFETAGKRDRAIYKVTINTVRS